MTMDFSIKSSRSEFNMASWCIEKSNNLVRSLAFMADQIHQGSSGSDNERNEFEATLGSALWDATKLLSFSCGSTWAVNHPRLILEEGYAGYEKVAVEYGILDETTAAKNERLRQVLLEKISSYLDGPRSPGRTLIHECLTNYRVRDEALDRLFQLTERVTLGDMSWEDYVPTAKDIVGRLRIEGSLSS